MRYTAGFLLVVVVMMATTASAASGSVEMRLRALESRVPDADRLAELEKSVGRQGAGVLAADVDQLKAEIRELRGQIEQLTYQIKKQQQSQQQLYGDLDKRLQTLEANASLHASSGGITQGPSEPTDGHNTQDTTGATTGQEQAEYLAAFEVLQQGKSGEAIHAFTGFLEKYPKSSYSSNAIYWLGEANYLNKDYPKALAEFQKLTNEYPDSTKMPGALLKIGFIHYETRNYPEARTVLERVKDSFPDNNVSKLADERLQRMKKEGV